MPARASPLYQAKNPRNIDTDARYKSAAPLARFGCGGLMMPDTRVRGRETGNARMTTQQITRQPGISRARRPPSAYPTDPRIKARTSSRSAARRLPALLLSAKITTVNAPVRLAAQKTRPGRSPARNVATAAVAAGTRPVTTAAWDALTCSSATAVSTPYPMPTPGTHASRLLTCRRVGRGDLVNQSVAPARSAAPTDLPAPMNTPSNPRRAIAVAGNVAEKRMTPRPASHMPDSAPRCVWVALT